MHVVPDFVHSLMYRLQPLTETNSESFAFYMLILITQNSLGVHHKQLELCALGIQALFTMYDFGHNLVSWFKFCTSDLGTL